MTETGLRMTADELLRLPDDGKRYELIAGELHEMSPAGGEHGGVGGRVSRHIGTFLDQHPDIGGDIFVADIGFRLARNPDTVRMPDVAYVSQKHLRRVWVSGYPDLAPDLVLEVVSPSDRASEVQAKADEWLEAGSRLVWVLYPATRTAMVYRAGGAAQLLHAEDTLTGDPVLPGFSCRLGDLFGPSAS